MALRLLVFLGSSRDGRNGENVAKCVVNMLKAKQHSVELIDPLSVGTDGHVHQPMHFHRDQSQVPEWMVETNAKIVEAQAFVIVSPEYNCSLPPALTGLIDQFSPGSYRHKPCAIVCYSIGPYGGIRAAAFARPFLSELGIVCTPSSCIIPKVMGKFSDQGDCLDEKVKNDLNKLIAELLWYGAAITQKKETDGEPVLVKDITQNLAAVHGNCDF